jgi:hypothetical protein
VATSKFEAIDPDAPGVTAESEPAHRPQPTHATIRDPWAWASALAALPLLLRSLGAPLGEPVAEDFDFLHRAVLSPANSLLDGGGSNAFWRPVAHQIYYELLGPTILSHPGRVAALHVILLALSGWLLYRIARRAFPGPVAAAIASFPLLAESTRTLIAWPSHFVDLGAFLFSAIALHEAARRRWWSALPSLALALLCKELAVVTAALMPFVPALVGDRSGSRARAMMLCGTVVVAWAAAYTWVRAHAGLELPHGLERDPALLHVPLFQRVAWAQVNSLRAIFSLARQPGPADLAVTGASVAILLVSVAVFAKDPRARERLRRSQGWVAGGLVWFVLAAASLASIFPLWSPNRSQFASVGLGAALVTTCAAAHPGLAGALVAVRLGALALAPGVPPVVTPEPVDRGAFIDFVRLTRLQRLMRAARTSLQRDLPTLPAGSTIGYRNLPLSTEYAFGGAHAVQAWYGDPTLRWTGVEAFERDVTQKVVVFLDYQQPPHPTIALLDPDAMRWMKIASNHLLAGRQVEALTALNRADTLQHDRTAAIFLGEMAGRRAAALIPLQRWADAEREARTALRASNFDIGARYVLALTYLARRDRREALVQVDSLLMVRPHDPDALALRDAILAAEAHPVATR